jgi:hypothetical protein
MEQIFRDYLTRVRVIGLANSAGSLLTLGLLCCCTSTMNLMQQALNGPLPSILNLKYYHNTNFRLVISEVNEQLWKP